jgi:hypothetical protein
MTHSVQSLPRRVPRHQIQKNGKERRSRVNLSPEDFDYHPSPAACHHSISRSSPLAPLCVLLVLDRARGPIRQSVGHLSSSVKVRVLGKRTCPHAQPAFVSTFYVVPDLHLSTTGSPAIPVSQGNNPTSGRFFSLNIFADFGHFSYYLPLRTGVHRRGSKP